jgi:hypothetical protein
MWHRTFLKNKIIKKILINDASVPSLEKKIEKLDIFLKNEASVPSLKNWKKFVSTGLMAVYPPPGPPRGCADGRLDWLRCMRGQEYQDHTTTTV